MATRTKPQPYIIETLAQADEALRKLAEIARSQAEIERTMNEEIDATKAVAARQMEPLAQDRARLENALGVFGTLKKGELFGEQRQRSQELTFGIIGFRRSTRLRLMAKHTWAKVLERVTDLGLTDAIRTKREVDKQVLADWPEERLETVGVVRETSDEFFVELKQEELPGQAA